MATTVTMPQLGETVTEGTILRWAKKVGDAIAEEVRSSNRLTTDGARSDDDGRGFDSAMTREFLRQGRVGLASMRERVELLVGRATRQCEALMNERKQYEAMIKFGATTATDDPESPEESFAHAGPVPRDEIERLLSRFVGAIQQRPPAKMASRSLGPAN